VKLALAVDGTSFSKSGKPNNLRKSPKKPSRSDQQYETPANDRERMFPND
jgi:hypothetical protein